MKNQKPPQTPIERLIHLLAEIEVEKYFQEVNHNQQTTESERHARSNLRTI